MHKLADQNILQTMYLKMIYDDAVQVIGEIKSTDWATSGTLSELLATIKVCLKADRKLEKI